MIKQDAPSPEVHHLRLSYHSSSGCVPLSLPHHPKGAGAQLLAQQQLAVLDQTRQSPTRAVLPLGWAAPVRLVRHVPASTAYHLQRKVFGYISVT